MITEFINFLQYEKNYSTYTVLSYKKDIEQFDEFLKSVSATSSLLDADNGVVRMWIAHLVGEKKLSATSTFRKLSSLRSFYKYLLKNNVVLSNPTAGVVAPKKSQKLPFVFTQKELDVFEQQDLVAVGNSFERFRNRLIVETLYQTGIRRAELITLKCTDIDFAAQTIKVFGKRRKERIIPFGNSLKHLFLSYLELKDKEGIENSVYFFVLKNGKQMYAKSVYNAVTQLMEQLTTKSKHSPHVLRHSFATTLLDNGAELSSIKELLGHSSLASTQVYIHASFAELKKIYNKSHPRN